MPSHSPLARTALAVAALLSVTGMDCATSRTGARPGDSSASAADTVRAGHARGRLAARVGVAGSGGAPGRHVIDSRSARGGLIIVPAGYDRAGPAPLLLLLHGAGGSAAGVLRRLPPGDLGATIVVAPDARAQTWDFIRGPFGADVAFIDSVLSDVFARYAVDRTRVTIGGFSDGASYALSLGMTNGDLFSRIVAWSPGMDGVIGATGVPRIFISHGTRDEVLDIERTSRRIVPHLRAKGYDVTYREFDGVHEVPPAIAIETMRWLAAP